MPHTHRDVSFRGAVGLLLALLAMSPSALVGCGGATESQPSQADLEDPIRQTPGETLFNQGARLANAGDMVRAEQYIAAAISRGYDEARAMPALMRVCVAASRVRAALAYAEPYLLRHPEDWRLRYVVGSLYHGLRDGTRAKDALERVINEQPTQPDPHFALGIVFKDDLNNRDAARRMFTHYIELTRELDPLPVKVAQARAYLTELASSDMQTLPEAPPVQIDAPEAPAETTP